MAKTFTDVPLNQFDQVKTDNITKNLDKSLAEFNGGLDSNNLPYQSIVDTKLKDAVDEPGPTGPVNKWGITYPSQKYFHTERRTSDIWAELFSVDLDTDTWSAGFGRLNTFDSNYDTFPLQFEAKEGMLVGCAVLDWEHGNQVFNVDDGAGNFVPRGRGFDWWTEWAVYVNNVMVARTGFIYPKRHTTQIPFAVACGSQDVTIDIRVKLNTWRADGSPSTETTSSPFKVFGTTIWCRNHFR